MTAEPAEPDSPEAAIPARSRAQARDWSLVLISQGIEAIIDRRDGNWVLLVDPPELAHATDAIEKYKAENRGWGWHRKVFKPGLVFDWTSIGWLVLIVVFYVLDLRFDFQTVGILDSRSVSSGQSWRLFTAVWLHADLPHLASNAVIGFVLLGLTMGRYGSGIGLLAAYLAGFGGNVLHWLFSPRPSLSLGASGMVLGSLGLLASQSFRLWRQAPQMRKYVVAGIAAGVMLLLLLGLAPGSDIIAHFGGFFTGVAFGMGLTGAVRSCVSGRLNLLCALIFAGLVIVPWVLAFRATPNFAK